jgi:hypothetical protein
MLVFQLQEHRETYRGGWTDFAILGLAAWRKQIESNPSVIAPATGEIFKHTSTYYAEVPNLTLFAVYNAEDDSSFREPLRDYWILVTDVTAPLHDPKRQRYRLCARLLAQFGPC